MSEANNPFRGQTPVTTPKRGVAHVVRRKPRPESAPTMLPPEPSLPADSVDVLLTPVRQPAPALGKMSDGRIPTGTMEELTVEEGGQPSLPQALVRRADENILQEIPDDDPRRGFLVVVSGNDIGRKVGIPEGRTTIGRGLDNDIVLTDIAVSRRHLVVERKGDIYFIEDLKSGNGTLINDREQVGEVLVVNKDEFVIGNTVIRFDGPGGAVDDEIDPNQTAAWGPQSAQAKDPQTDSERTVAGKGRPDVPNAPPLPEAPPPPRMHPVTNPPPAPTRAGTNRPRAGTLPPRIPEPAPRAATNSPRAGTLPPADAQRLAPDPPISAIPQEPSSLLELLPDSGDLPSSGELPRLPMAQPPKPSIPYPAPAPRPAHAYPVPLHAPANMGPPMIAGRGPGPGPGPAGIASSRMPMVGIRQPPLVQQRPPDRRGLLIGIISVALVLVVVGIVAAVVGQNEPESIATAGADSHDGGVALATTGLDAAPVTAGVLAIDAGVVAVQASQDASAAPTPVIANKPLPDKPLLVASLIAGTSHLPTSTWGTDETFLASIPASNAIEPTPVEPTPDPPPVDPKPDPTPAVDPKPDPAPAVDSKPPRKPTVDRKPPRNTRKNNPRKPPRRNNPDEFEVDTPRTSRSTNAVKKAARALYKREQFDAAADKLRDEADSIDDDSTAADLLDLANTFEQVGELMAKASSLRNSSPTESLRTYKKALMKDKQASKGFHQKLIRLRIGEVAPLAAKSFMVKKRYPDAKKAADDAARYDNRGAVEAVYSSLEKRAESMIRKALKLKRKDEDEALRLLREVTKFAPRDSEAYQDARDELRDF